MRALPRMAAVQDQFLGYPLHGVPEYRLADSGGSAGHLRVRPIILCSEQGECSATRCSVLRQKVTIRYRF